MCSGGAPSNPGGMVVAYVNTSAAVKAESDICCTSSNAVEVVESLPQDREILFLPDMFLGQHVARRTGRHIDIWMGECHVHAAISPVQLRERVAAHPRSELFIHPECGCTTSALWMAENGDFPKERTHVLSTAGMVKAAQRPRGRARPGGNRDRHPAPVARRQPEGDLRGCVPPGRVPVHEDDHAPTPARLPSREGVHVIEVDEAHRRARPSGCRENDRDRFARRR